MGIQHQAAHQALPHRAPLRAGAIERQQRRAQHVQPLRPASDAVAGLVEMLHRRRRPDPSWHPLGEPPPACASSAPPSPRTNSLRTGLAAIAPAAARAGSASTADTPPPPPGAARTAPGPARPPGTPPASCCRTGRSGRRGRGARSLPAAAARAGRTPAAPPAGPSRPRPPAARCSHCIAAASGSGPGWADPCAAGWSPCAPAARPACAWTCPAGWRSGHGPASC